MSRASDAPLRRIANCARTRVLGVVWPQTKQVADPLRIVPDVAGSARSVTRNVTALVVLSTVASSTTEVAFRLANSSDRMSGTSAPHPGPSQRMVRAHRYAMGVAPSGSLG